MRRSPTAKETLTTNEETFYAAIKETAENNQFWEQQGKGIVGTKIPDTVAEINRICTAAGENPTKETLHAIQEKANNKILATLTEEKKLDATLLSLQKHERSLMDTFAYGNVQKKLIEIGAYKHSQQYKFYRAIVENSLDDINSIIQLAKESSESKAPRKT
jgi:hypothetical protein